MSDFTSILSIMINTIKRKLRNRLNVWLATDDMIPLENPVGHFYSAICDPNELRDNAEQIWSDKKHNFGIDMNQGYHQDVLNHSFPQFIEAFNYVEKKQETSSDTQYYIQNSQYSWFDARLLFVMLNRLKPQKVIEVGSGFSSLLIADVNHRLLNNAFDFTCIEPFPRDFLRKDIKGLNQVIVEKVQTQDVSIFETLNQGDILFIDSSHVSKTGSDVNYIVFEILPRLKKGVIIHFHDIYLPYEYPKEWAIDLNRSWNEQYILQAMLMYSSAFRVLFGSNYAFNYYPELVAKALQKPLEKAFGGVSLWIERI